MEVRIPTCLCLAGINRRCVRVKGMVQRLSLHGVVSKDELPIALRSLEAVSGMQGHEFHSKKQIYEPKYRFVPPTPQSAQTEQYRLFVVYPDVADSTNCNVEAQEIPEAGRNIKLISQSVDSSPISQGDVGTFMQSLGYQYKSEFELKGLEFVLHKNLVLHIFQLFNGSELLDKSEQRIVVAFVDVESVTDLPAVEKANSLLLSTQQELKGVLSLQVPARQSFNTRMPRVQQR